MLGSTGRFRRTDRLLVSVDFRRVGRVGKRASNRFFVVLLAAPPTSGNEQAPRLGITVSRRVGNAVVRNQIKRGVREWFRRDRGKLGAKADLVVIARRDAATLTVGQIGHEVGGLVDSLRKAEK